MEIDYNYYNKIWENKQIVGLIKLNKKENKRLLDYKNNYNNKFNI